jgi:predicted metalloendopeptidase
MPYPRLPLVLMMLACGLACVATHPEETASSGGGSAAVRITPQQLADDVLGAMDRTVDPCQDFYQYACGTWRRTSQIPADRSSWGRGFSEIEERNQALLRDILERAAKAQDAEADHARIGRFFGSCMDEEAVERTGLGLVQPLLREIDSVRDASSLLQAAGHLHLVGAEALFEPEVFADFKDPDTSIAYYLQGGIGLPDREYYLSDDEQHRALRGQYQAHVGKMLTLLGESAEAAQRHAAAILEFETQLARVSLPREEARDLERIYHKIDLAGLKATAPDLPWDLYLSAIGYPALRDINVGMPDFFKGLSSLATRTPPETLQAYLRWHLVHAMAKALPRAFVDEDFGFFGRVLSGQKEIQPRWKRCVEATDEALGEILGRLYVERAFTGDSKPIALEMIEGIEASLGRAFADLAWMDDTTRERARGKLAQVTNKIGFPDRWRDYGALRVGGDYLGNMLEATRFEFRRQLDKVGKPVDKKEWGMTPPTVNAYYNPTVNEMVFPAGILQPPFFSRDFPRAMNYGAVGMAMGHELTHGFDDQGRKFDGTGQMREWWEPSVVARFEERAKCVEDLYSGYEVEPGVKVNGKLTLGENIADLGGIKESYGAYKAWEAEHGAPPSPVPGLTNDQLFFLGYAQSWCQLMTPERARLLVSVDPHSPARFRVQGPLASFPAFAQAFSCAPGTPMNPANRCEVW